VLPQLPPSTSKVSGFSDIDGSRYPSATCKVEMIGRPCPQMPTYLPSRFAGADGHLPTVSWTAASRSSKRFATRLESRFPSPKVSWSGRSSLSRKAPVEVLQEVFGQQRVGRDLAHHDQAQSHFAALQAVLPSSSTTSRASCTGARTATMISHWLAHASRTFFHRKHSSSKQSLKAWPRHSVPRRGNPASDFLPAARKVSPASSLRYSWI